jgi:hypothetical protein
MFCPDDQNGKEKCAPAKIGRIIGHETAPEGLTSGPTNRTFKSVHAFSGRGDSENRLLL